MLLDDIGFLSSNDIASMEVLKDACTSIGFKTKTEKHGECVLELHKRSDELKLFKVSESKNHNESFQKTNRL